jgi:predicted MFS family arabinose efflux permease
MNNDEPRVAADEWRCNTDKPGDNVSVNSGLPRASAIRFVIFLGTVSLFADITYEGMRGVLGPYFVTLGSSAAVVGMVAGAGELAGFALRLLTGYLADRTRAYWTLTIIGYTVNLVAVPALAFAGHWGVAAALVIAERTGKSIRTPARDVMLSQAAHSVGRGWGFGLHAALDQVGAITGPLLMAYVIGRTGSYATAFKISAIPAALALTTLFLARASYPHPHELEPAGVRLAAKGYPREFWIYVAAAALLATGFADFPLIAYHLQKHGILSAAAIPLAYAGAMAVNGAGALVFGKLYDRLGVMVIAAGIACSAAGLPLAFYGGFAGAIAGILLWGAAMGAMDAVLRAGVAAMIPRDQRGAAYGVYHAAFGVAWFAGSAIMGRLYDSSIDGLVAFGMAAQAGAIVSFAIFRIYSNRRGPVS